MRVEMSKLKIGFMLQFCSNLIGTERETGGDHQLEVTYRAITTGKEAKTYPVHPLGLVIMEQVVYLVCTVKDYQDPLFLAMHRIDQACMLDLPAI